MIETDVIHREPLQDMDHQKILQDLNSSISAVQRLIDNDGKASSGSMELQQARDALSQADQWLRRQKKVTSSNGGVDPLQTLLDVLPVGIAIFQNGSQKTMTLNQAGLRLMNLPLDQKTMSLPLKRPLPFKFIRGGHVLKDADIPLLQAIAKNTPMSDVELDVQHSNGKTINLIAYISPLFNGKGRPVGTLGVMVDITARKSIEQRLTMQYAISQILAEANTVNKAAPQVIRLICETAQWEYGALWQVDGDLTTLINKGVWYARKNLAAYAEKADYSLLNAEEDTLPGTALKTGKPIWLSSLKDGKSAYIQEAKEAGFHTAYVVPIRARKKVIAVLEFLSDHQQDQDVHLTEMINAVGSQVGVFLERKVLEDVLTVRADQQRLLADAGFALSTTVKLEARLMNIAHLVVPELADWCAIDVIDKDNVLRRMGAAHVDSKKTELLNILQPTRKIDFSTVNTPQIETLKTGQSLIFPELPDEMMQAALRDPKQKEAVEILNPISSIIVPLIAHNQVLGIFTLVQSDSGRRYSMTDLPLAEDIARRTALAVDNAILYNEAQRLNNELEQRVDKRTGQLKLVIEELTRQVVERQNAEERARILNAELEERIAQRTIQLADANAELNKELEEKDKTGEQLKALLKRTRELYRISQTIGVVKTPTDVLSLLLSTSYLKSSSRASIAILDRPWMEGETPPEHCFILTEWNRGASLPKFAGQHFTLEEYGVRLPVSYGEPIVIQDIQSVMELSPSARARFFDLKTHSLIILPLIASGECYGLLSLHFKTRRMTTLEDLRHMRGLVDEAAIVIKNMRLLETESQARQEAERANELKLKFLGMVSHELRTPLTSIKGFTTTLLADDVEWPADKQHDFLKTINEESDKLHELIEQLLDLSRIEAGVLRIAPVEVSLQKIIDSAHPQLSALTREHRLKIDLPPDLPHVYADEQRIAQVITNLVNNAVKFSPAGSQISISAYRSGYDLQVDVADEGPGIPLEQRQHVFQAFKQLENSRSNHSKGAGLGLAICKGLIEAHKGRIWVQERDVPGTVISFMLPVMAK